jgi:hypothetical protein
MLGASADRAEVCVSHVEVRVNSEGEREETAPIGRVAVEELADVEIAVGASIGDRIGGLVQRIVVCV